MEIKDAKVKVMNEQNYDIIFTEDFTNCNTDNFKEALTLPQYCGKPQTIRLETNNNRNILYMKTEESPSCKRRGILLAENIKIEDAISVELSIKPIGQIDGISELCITSPDGTKGISLELFGGNYGWDKETIAEFDNELIFAPNNIWEWNKWYYLHIQMQTDKTIMALLNQDRMILWRHCFNRPVTDLFDTFNISLAQELDTPGPGTYCMEAYVADIKVGKQDEQSLQELDKMLSKQEYDSIQVLTKIQNNSYQEADVQQLHDLEPFVHDIIETEFCDNDLVIKYSGDHMSMRTKDKYTLPLKIQLTAKTDSTNIRMYYKNGEVIFNWECNEDELRVHDIISGQNYGYYEKGNIPKNQYVDIEWIIDKDYMAIYVDKELRHAGIDYPYIEYLKESSLNKINDYVRVSAAWGSTVTVRSLSIAQINNGL